MQGSLTPRAGANMAEAQVCPCFLVMSPNLHQDPVLQSPCQYNYRAFPGRGDKGLNPWVLARGGSSLTGL